MKRKSRKLRNAPSKAWDLVEDLLAESEAVLYHESCVDGLSNEEDCCEDGVEPHREAVVRLEGELKALFARHGI